MIRLGRKQRAPRPLTSQEKFGNSSVTFQGAYVRRHRAVSQKRPTICKEKSYSFFSNFSAAEFMQ